MKSTQPTPKSLIIVESIWTDCSMRRNHVGLSRCKAKGFRQNMKLQDIFGTIKEDISKQRFLVHLR